MSKLDNHIWQFVKYKGDCALYAKCSCGFRYSCCRNANSTGLHMVIAPEKLYNYCPMCGTRKTGYVETIQHIDEFPWDA